MTVAVRDRQREAACGEGTRGHVFLARPRGGGVGTAAAGAARELRRRGWRVSEVALGEDEAPAASAARTAFRHRRTLRDADVVHVELGALDATTFWFGLLATRIGPTIVVAHDAPGLSLAPGAGLIRCGTRWRDIVGHRLLAPLLDGPLRSLLASRTRVGVVLTEEAKSEWAASGPSRIVVTDHGSDPASADRLRPSQGRHVLCAGFIGPGKGTDVLVDAWERLGPSSPLPLVIAGTHTGGVADRRFADRLRERADAMARPPLWRGFVSDLELRRLFAEAAVVVVPYRRSNPASGIIVHAMTEGRPVVATRVPAALDAIRDGVDGILVSPGDATALAAGLGQVLADPQLRDRLGDAGGSRAADRFTWDRHIAGLEAAYAQARASR